MSSDSFYLGLKMMNSNEMALQILRLDQVKEKTGLSRSSIYSFTKDGSFPMGVHLGPRAVGWLESEVDAWLAGCVAARGSREIA